MERQKVVASRPALWTNRPAVIPFCQGCQHGIIGRLICEAVEEMGIEGKTIIIGGVGCHAMISFMVDFDSIQVPHGRAPDVASAAKRVLGRDTIVTTIQGDGDCIAIGTESLIQAAARAERITIIMANNGNYGTTGGQMAPTSILGQKTTTTPEGRELIHGFPIHAAELVAGLKGTAFSARGSLTSSANFQRTKKCIKTALQKQIDNVGFSFVEILTACPPNWHLSPLKCLAWIEDEMTREFPLGEFKNVDRLE